MSLTIKTNNKPRELFHGGEIPFSLFLDGGQFDYLKVTDEGFSNYRFFKFADQWYDSFEFTSISQETDASNAFIHSVASDSPLAKWDGITHHSIDSGLLIRFVRDDYDSVYDVVVGRFY